MFGIGVPSAFKTFYNYMNRSSDSAQEPPSDFVTTQAELPQETSSAEDVEAPYTPVTVELAEPTLKERFCTYWTMSPGVALLTICVVGLFFALVMKVYWMMIPFGVGILAAGAVMYMAYYYKNLQSFGQNNRLYDANNQVYYAHLQRMNGENINLRNQVAGLQEQVTRFEAATGNLEEKVGRLETVKGDLEQQHRDASEHLERVKGELKAAEDQRKASQKVFEQTKEGLEGANKELDQKITGLKDEIADAQEHAAGLKKNLDEMVALKAKYDEELQSNLGHFRQLKDTFTSINESTKSDHSTLGDNLEKAIRIVSTIEEANTRVVAASNEAKEELGEAKEALLKEVEQGFCEARTVFVEWAQLACASLQDTDEWKKRETGLYEVIGQVQTQQKLYKEALLEHTEILEKNAKVMKKMGEAEGVVKSLEATKDGLNKEVRNLGEAVGLLKMQNEKEMKERDELQRKLKGSLKRAKRMSSQMEVTSGQLMQTSGELSRTANILTTSPLTSPASTPTKLPQIAALAAHQRKEPPPSGPAVPAVPPGHVIYKV